jgi:hypothetical protein
MSREDARTVSRAVINVTEDEISMSYTELQQAPSPATA